MLKKIYSNPYKVYLIALIFVLLGIYSATKISSSLFPMAQRPGIGVWIPYGPYSNEQFYHEFGTLLEDHFKKIQIENSRITSITSRFNDDSAYYEIQFDWGTSFNEAKKEVKNSMNGLSNLWPKEVRDNYSIYPLNRSSGFFVATFTSKTLDMTQIYEILNPLLRSPLGQIEEIEQFYLWNPNEVQLIIELNPYALTTLGITPSKIESKIREHLNSFQGGTLRVGETELQLMTPKGIQKIEDLERIQIPIGNSRNSKDKIPLGQLGNIFSSSGEGMEQIFKTNGMKGIMLYARVKQGANIRNMSNRIKSVLTENEKRYSDKIHTNIMIDPSKFIDDSVSNVIKEVVLSAGLAVLILYLFIGGLTNTLTAAIEIPMSMVLSFIIMKIDGMNINLISLAGLALASGMNVDASIVVMENIFTKIKLTSHLKDRNFLDIIYESVKEVIGPLTSSTLISLIVFIPLIFTSNISQSILGDLAKAVVYSHGISLFVAILLVPTIRYHLFSRIPDIDKKILQLDHPPLEKLIHFLEENYERSLNYILSNIKVFKKLLYVFPIFIILSIFFIHPRLTVELIGKPDTNYVVIHLNTTGNTLINQMEEQMDNLESRVKKLLGNKLQETFNEVWGPSGGQILAKIKNKKEIDNIVKLCEKEFVSTPKEFFSIKTWNPAELPLPEPPEGRVLISGKNSLEMDKMARDFYFKLMETGYFSTYHKEPGINQKDFLRMKPKFGMELPISIQEIGQYMRIILSNFKVGEISVNNIKQDIQMKFPLQTIDNIERVESWPIKVGNKIVPLKAYLDIERVPSLPSIYRKNDQEVHVIDAKLFKERMGEKRKMQQNLKKFVKDYNSPYVTYDDADKEIRESLYEVIQAIIISVVVMFLILFFQLGKLPLVLIIMTAIPTGIFGVYLSLFVMDSTLSLNSTLGMILLNGLTVANSIIMIDFILIMLKSKDYNTKQAIIFATRVRLRPILMTALTTILGMLPIALGLGDGGKIIRPLGISVVGGLSVSTFFTLFIVPILTYLYLSKTKKPENT